MGILRKCFPFAGYLPLRGFCSGQYGVACSKKKNPLKENAKKIAETRSLLSERAQWR